MATASLATMKQQQGGGAVAAVNPVKAKLQLLEKKKALLGAGASESIKVDREIRAAGIMLMNSGDLQAAKPESFYTAVANAINSGIGLCNGRGYLVAYKGNCNFVPGWKGLIDLVARTGRATAWTGVVYKGDKFAYELGGDPYLRHQPVGDSDDWKEATHVYAIGRIKGSDYPIIECWTINKIVKHLNKFNKVGGKHYALKDDNNMEMYARKIVLLQAIKYLPSSQDMENALAAEHASEMGREVVLNGDYVYVPDENGDHLSDQPPVSGNDGTYEQAQDVHSEPVGEPYYGEPDEERGATQAATTQPHSEVIDPPAAAKPQRRGMTVD